MSLLSRGAVNLGGGHRQTCILVAFPERRNPGRSNDSQLDDPSQAEQLCVFGRESAREKTLFCCSWGLSCTKTRQTEDLGHFPDIPGSATQVGISVEQRDRMTLGKGQATRAGLESFSLLPTQETILFQKSLQIEGGNPNIRVTEATSLAHLPNEGFYQP